MARSNLYGADENSFAERIADAALTTSNGDADYHGSATDSRAASDGNHDDPGEVVVTHNKGSK